MMDTRKTTPSTGEQTSLWKKELSFRRKPKPATVTVAETVVEEPVAVAETAAEEPVAEKPKPATVAVAETAAEEPVAEKPSRKQRRAASRLARGEAKRGQAETSKQPQEPKLSRKERRLQAKGRRHEAKRTATERMQVGAERSRATKAPSFGRKKRVVGLKIGSSQLVAASVVNNGHPDLVQVAREPLEPGIVVGGEPRRPEELANALTAFFTKHKLPKSGVRLGIASNRIGVRTLEIAGIDDPKQLGNAIRFRAQEALPIPLEEAVLDYQVLSERVDESGQTVRRVLLVVAYRDLIDRYVSACRSAGIKLAGIDLEAFGLLRALTVPRTADEQPRSATVVVNVGHDRSTFGVSDGLHCEFTRVLDWGGSKLGVAIARALDLAPSEAVSIKHGLSLLEPVTPAGLTEEQGQKAREAAEKELHAFARELVSALQFYQNQPGSLGIGEVVLTGGTAELPGIDSELNRLIGVPVRVGDPLVNVRLGKKLDVPAGLGSLATAIGLGIELP